MTKQIYIKRFYLKYSNSSEFKVKLKIGNNIAELLTKSF